MDGRGGQRHSRPIVCKNNKMENWEGTTLHDGPEPEADQELEDILHVQAGLGRRTTRVKPAQLHPPPSVLHRQVDVDIVGLLQNDFGPRRLHNSANFGVNLATDRLWCSMCTDPPGEIRRTVPRWRKMSSTRLTSTLVLERKGAWTYKCPVFITRPSGTLAAAE